MNLYEIELKIMECIDEETGEIINDELLTDLENMKKDKIENICLYIKNLQAEGTALKNEIDALTERKKKTENKMNRLTEYLTNVLNGTKFKTSKVEVSYRKSKSIEVHNKFIEWALNENKDLLSFKEPVPNKTKIKALIEEGQDIKYATIKENNNIKIK